jgi:predicted DNA-binding protein
MKNPRVSVTLNSSDAEVMHILCKKKGLSMSSLVKRMVEDWLEEYEDVLLAKRAEEAERKWEESGKPTITHEELWKRLDS